MFAHRWWLALLLCGQTIGVGGFVLYPFRAQTVLNDSVRVAINWEVDYVSNVVNFAIEVESIKRFRWFAVGFSDIGEFAGSDVCLFSGNVYQDSWIDWQGTIKADTQQDCAHASSARLPDGRTLFLFSRRFDTCDSKDYQLEAGTTQFVVAMGRSAWRNVFGRQVLKTIVPNRVLRTVELPEPLPADTREFEITMENIEIPAQETMYWCSVQRLPKMAATHHIIKYEASIQAGNEEFVHHMEVFHCEKSILRMPKYNGVCAKDRLPDVVKHCTRVLGAWAMGAEPFVYPEEAGIPIGGAGYFPFVMIEIHYNNPRKKTGATDRSGLRFYYTPNLRPFDAGILETGLIYSDQMAIPPGSPAFPLTGYCAPDCTDLGLPEDGIVIFGSQLHSHLAGHRLETRLVRAGEEAAVVNRDNHFTTHWQEIRHLSPTVRLFPGGLGIHDEMCVNYIHYYPKAELEVCKSDVDSSALKLFFDYLKSMGDEATDSEKEASLNYKSIKWSNAYKRLLFEFYQVAPLKMNCLKNNGVSFPGNWNNLPIPETFKELPPESSDCSFLEF